MGEINAREWKLSALQPSRRVPSASGRRVAHAKQLKTGGWVMELTIPEAHHGAFRAINCLSAKHVDTLVESLQSTQPTFRESELVSVVADVAGLDRREAQEIVTALTTLYVVREQFGIELERFVNELVRSAEANISLKRDRRRTWKALRHNLSALLRLDDSIGITAKGITVLTDHARVFRAARVISDLRPIFSQSSLEAPVAATVVHMLKLDFIESERRRSFFVALDANGLQSLREVVDRALAKNRALRELCQSTSLAFLDVENLRDREDLG